MGHRGHEPADYDEEDKRCIFTFHKLHAAHTEVLGLLLPAPGGVSPVDLTDSVSKASYAVGAAMVYIQPTKLQ